MTTANSSFKASTLLVPAVTAASAGIFSMFTSLGDLNMNILSYPISAPLGIALVAGVSSLITQVNKDYLLPMLGFKDLTTWNSFYIGTALATGVAVVGVYAILNMFNGEGIGDISSLLMMFTIGAGGAIVGQWAGGLSDKTAVVNSSTKQANY